jgi:molybdenum cofactor synthesis domain-containing protein
MPVKVVKAEDAVGKVLAYDVTTVTPESMGSPLRKGHVIRPEDIDILKTSGHYYVYIVDGSYSTTSEVYEDEAVLELGKMVAGEGTAVYARQGGKALIRAAVDGALIINEEGVKKVNESGDFALITRPNWIGVRKSDALAIIDLIPFSIERSVLEKIRKKLGAASVIRVEPYKNLKFGVIVTGNEVYEGRVRDNASPVVKEKVEKYGGKVAEVSVLPDDKEVIKDSIKKFLEKYDGVIATGGMSVDPTDFTHIAIKEVADEVIAYGIPIKPTTMTMIAYSNGKPLIGVSSGIIFFREWNSLDVLLPKVMAGVKWRREEIMSLALGGLHDIYLRRLRL